MNNDKTEFWIRNADLTLKNLYFERLLLNGLYTIGECIHFVDYLPFFDKGDNFCDFLFAFPSKKMSTLKGKNCSHSFILE